MAEQGDTTLETTPEIKPKKGGLKALMGFFNRISGADGDEIGDEAQLPEGSMVHNMIVQARAFHDLRVEDLMVPRIDIVGLDSDISFDQALMVCIDSEHSRLPLYRETLDDPIGIIHIKDVLKYLVSQQYGEKDAKALFELVRPSLYVPASMRASDLLLQMQAKRIHMALVIDEFGGTDGLITLEDLIEAVVGEIEDEHDEGDENPNLKSLGGQDFEADGRVELKDVQDQLGIDLINDQALEEEIDTVAGLVTNLADRVPQRGEVINFDEMNYEIEILDADARRIKRVRFKKTTERLAKSLEG